MDKQTKIDDEYEIRSQTSAERERITNTDDEIPQYKIKINLSDEQVERLKNDIFIEYEALKSERGTLKLASRWTALDNQYHGNMKTNDRLHFNLHVHQSKIKEDAIVRALNEAFLDSDPRFEVTPRPEMARQDGEMVSDKQSEFLDFSIDEEVKPEHALMQINHSAVRKYVGIGKLCWEYDRDRRKREETYIGKNTPVGVSPDGHPVFKNEGLERFIRAYPNAMEKYTSYVQRLSDGKTINIVVEYYDIVENNPKFKYVPVEDFYVSNKTDGYDGLRKSHLIAERQVYSWWELRDKENAGEFSDIDKIKSSGLKEGESPSEDDYKTRTYNVLEFTYMFRINESDRDETKIKCWFEEDNKTFLGVINYPYYGFEIDYIPFYVKLNERGFYGDARSVISDLQDSNIAQNALLNLALHGTYVRNVLTPIVREGSEIEAIFLEKRFKEGAPLPVDEMTDDVSKAFDFVKWPQMQLGDILSLGHALKKGDDDVSGVSGLMSGRESEVDPRAPASKTIALLEQSSINIKDYIRVYLPGFNVLATNILQLYYQMATDSRKYRMRKNVSSVAGNNAFEQISRDEMVAKTTIQSRAASFVFEKVNEKKENMAIYQILKSDPYAQQIPELQYKALKELMRSWSARWKYASETALPTPEEFQQQMMQVAQQAIQGLMQQAQQQEQTTGVAPEMGDEQVMGAVTQAQTVAMNPQLGEE